MQDATNPNLYHGIVTNSSRFCAYEVGMASYKKFDTNLNNQELFDSDPDDLWGDGSTIIQPGQTLELTVEAPICAAQIDVYFDASYLGAYGFNQADLDLVPLTLPGSQQPVRAIMQSLWRPSVKAQKSR